MGRRLVLVSAAALLLFTAAGSAAVITGTTRADFLRGGPRADRIDGRGGNDRIKVDGGRRDTVRCGRGRDLVNADAADRVARDCETVVRVIARDRYSAPAQHSSIAEPDSFAWGNTIVAAFQSGRFQDGGAVNTGWATSRDGGRTWRAGVLPSLTRASVPAGRWARASDPVVAYDAVHRTWLIASLALNAATAAVVVSRSPDGLRWSAPVTVIEAPSRPNLSLDKEWIVCDNGAASPHRGSCYVTYSDFRTLRLEFQASRDGGLTWSGQVAAPDNAGRGSIIGRWAPAPQPVVQPDGDLIVAYYDEDRVAAIRSVDGARSFSPSVTVAATAFRSTPRLRAPPLPSAEVDATGTIYVAWPDCGNPCASNTIVVSSSADGIAWSPPRRPGLGRRGPQYVLPGIAADPVRPGRLALVYYVSTAGAYLDVGFVTSADGGRRWSAPRRLNAQTMRYTWIAQAGGTMVGDYFSTSFVGDTAVPVFVLASPPGARLNQPLFAGRFRVR
ncbi:MAG TPA: sialidase family protein [Gaiellaceae bacterium]|nr:sialidase family protein [Gaiellaceae bacterium]